MTTQGMSDAEDASRASGSGCGFDAGSGFGSGSGECKPEIMEEVEECLVDPLVPSVTVGEPHTHSQHPSVSTIQYTICVCFICTIYTIFTLLMCVDGIILCVMFSLSLYIYILQFPLQLLLLSSCPVPPLWNRPEQSYQLPRPQQRSPLL